MPLIENPLVDKVEYGWLSATYIDVLGQRKSFKIRNIKGAIADGDAASLARDIAEVSNACLVEYSYGVTKGWYESDWYAFDEAQSSVTNVMVLTFENENAPGHTQEVLIPAFDMSYVLDDQITPDIDHDKLPGIIDKAREILSGDDDPLTTERTWRLKSAYTTVRKAGRKRSSNVAQLPEIREPDALDEPGGGPAT